MRRKASKGSADLARLGLAWRWPAQTREAGRIRARRPLFDREAEEQRCWSGLQADLARRLAGGLRRGQRGWPDPNRSERADPFPAVGGDSGAVELQRRGHEASGYPGIVPVRES